MRQFVFVSGNISKVQWLETFIGQTIEHEKLDLKEIQSLNPVEVVEEKAKEAYLVLAKPVLIEDTTLRFSALGKLPGPFIKYFLQELGNNGLCELLDGYNDRRAIATVTYGFYDGITFEFFGEEVEGTISNTPKGSNGHGWDPIFIPKGQLLTYAEMSDEQYKKYSVRNKAVLKLKEWL